MAIKDRRRRANAIVTLLLLDAEEAPSGSNFPPSNLTEPAILGLFVVGETATLDLGAWSGWPEPALTWEILDSANGDAEIASGDADTLTYDWQAEDEGAEPFLRVTATNSEDTAVEDSAVYGPVTDTGSGNSLLLESGDEFLLETGDQLLLET